MTTTPFGFPVVPEVYITSAMSSRVGRVARSPSSEATRSDHDTVAPGPVLTTVGTAASNSGLTSLHNATDTPAWRRMAGSSAGPSLASSGTAIAPVLWMA